MSEYLDDVTAAKRFTSVTLASFAGIGVLLAVMEIYGVIAYLVAQRREIGIRLALGAPRSAVVFLWAVWPTNRYENLCTMNPGARRQGSLSHWMS
jgi:hypothetical protein